MMTKKQMVKWYSNVYETSMADSAQIIRNVCNMIEDIIASGETVRFPGVATFGVKMTTPRRIYDPQSGEIRMTTSRPAAFVKLGSRLKEAARNAPVVRD